MKMVHRVAIEFVPENRKDKQYYADEYKCWPPPLFLPIISLMEVSCFIYYSLDMKEGVSSLGPVPANSIFIYRPDKRQEIWRFILYMLLHAGWIHLFFNMLVQLLVGIPLEMVHGSLRIGSIYLAGVLAGSLGTSVFDMDAFLLGASGGVYALLAAHLSNVVLNYAEMELALLKVIAIAAVAAADIGIAVYNRYSKQGEPPVAYVAHVTGALAGLTIGIVVLKNFAEKLHKQILWWIALGIYGACTLFAILWNILYY